MYQDRLRFEDAIREFETAVNDPEYRLGAHFALGECHRARGRIDRAVEHFITVLKIVDLQTVNRAQADKLIELYENLADSLVTRGEPDRATAFANTLVEFLSHKGWEDKVRDARERLDALAAGGTMILGDILTSGSEHVLESLYLSQEYAKRSLYNAAMEEAYRVIQLSPDYLPAHMQLGNLLARQKRTEAAAQKFSTVGDAFRSRGDINNAISAYERVVRIAPLDVATRSRLIDLTKSHGEIDVALEHFMSLGDAYYQLAQLEKARDAYQDGLKLAPRGSRDKKWRARFLRQIGDIDMQRLDWPRALNSFRELRREEPGDERTAMRLIDLYYKVGQSSNARRALDEYLIELIKSGRGAKVAGILEDMVRQHPQDQGLVERLARLYTQQGRRSEAVELLDRLGEELLNAGQTQRAITIIERILALNPPNAASYEQLLADLRRNL
jgi:tetratricopeptide (TPR) repeat protein